MKEKVNVTGVPETMVQTLYARAKETKKQNAKIKDEIAVELVEKLDYDFSIADKDNAMNYGVIARTIVLDRMVEQYLEKNANTIVINIACGLDTRCYRMKGKYLHWYNIDLPETMKIRRQFLPETGPIYQIAKSAMDDSYIDDIDYHGKNILVIIEGLTMYLYEKDIRKMFSIIDKSFQKVTVHKLGVNVMTMSPGKKDYGHHNYPLERIEKSINWLKMHSNQKIGIVGASTTGTLALTAASYFEDITLTIGLTPSDFIWQGFMQGKKDGCKEWPIEGESLFSYKGEPLPYMPFCYKHPDYWHVIKKETKRTGDMINSRKLFDDSEKAHPITEDEMIKIEKIHGTLLLIGAEDDVLWDTAKYIRRMKQRMEEHPHTCRLEFVIYEHGTHFVFPDSMLKTMLPVGSGLFVKLAFQAARKYPEECRRARLDIDQRVRNAVAKWKRVDR